jgi:hypothetical protein
MRRRWSCCCSRQLQEHRASRVLLDVVSSVVCSNVALQAFSLWTKCQAAHAGQGSVYVTCTLGVTAAVSLPVLDMQLVV